MQPAADAKRKRPWYRPSFIDWLFIAAIVGILAAVFLPADHDAPRYLVLNMHTAHAELQRMSLDIGRFQEARRRVPQNNEELGWPKDGLVQDDGRHVYRIARDGTVQVHVYTRCLAHEKHCEPGTTYETGQMSYRPVLDGQGGLRFVCGNAPVPSGFRALGENRTTLTGSSLPRQCR